MNEREIRHDHRMTERAALYRHASPAFAHWAAGYGVIEHDDATQVRIHEMATDLAAQRAQSTDAIFATLAAADRVASAALWLVAHATYAQNVRTDGRDLAAEDFKPHPEGHTGGSLNMVPAYVGYLAANALSGLTRSWVMGQGHCVAAIDAVNLIVGNLYPEQAARYDRSDEGLTRFVRDFYSYAISADGKPAAPLGSHVNPHTAGGVLEGGYLGFAELQYVHIPLPGERLVAFLSDGAFEEQRGSDWAPRWWRAEDSGLVCPIMIANGRRIEQRTTVAQSGGVDWLRAHLALNGFDPLDIDGRDPAAFAWAIWEMESRLTASAHSVAQGRTRYPVLLPYAVAEAPKGFGFPGAGTNAAHNLPLVENPAFDEEARQRFNRGARVLWVPPAELSEALSALNSHERQQRPRERDHAAAHRQVSAAHRPEPHWAPVGTSRSPMAAIDEQFCRIVQANPELRPRVGNPDELRSNGMSAALDLLKHRVTAPEPGIAEAVDGKVITALNEEAVVSAALGNKGGINLVVTYEAFAPKMQGAIRQELIFARHQREVGRAPGWLAVPLVLTSHTWENGKNEQSHQDPSLCESLMGELGDVSRVLFPADGNSAAAALQAAYGAHGEIWTLVVPKRPVIERFDGAQARALVEQGALRVRGQGDEPLQLVATGAYQLDACLRASDRLTLHHLAHSVVYLLEPGRYRVPRDRDEAARVVGKRAREALFPPSASRVFVTHTRPEPFIGVVRPLDAGWERTRVLGYLNRGGTLDAAGMLLANACSWSHVVAAAAEMLRVPGSSSLLTPEETAAIHGEGSPRTR